jgi:hypothetical protein
MSKITVWVTRSQLSTKAHTKNRTESQLFNIFTICVNKISASWTSLIEMWRDMAVRGPFKCLKRLNLLGLLH